MKNWIATFLCLVLLQGLRAQEKPEGLFINSKAADFKARDQNGKEVVLKDLRKQGPVVVIFYRGFWCPYCNKELKRFNDSLQLLKDKGATLIAITPEGKEGVDSTVAKTGAVFSIISDEGMRISNDYHVAFTVDERSLNRYKSFGVDLLKTNNQKEAMLDVPAAYIINRDGAVTFRYFNEDFRKQVSVKEILGAL
ncbi:MAG: peroxiredoxin-like family protein [Flavisolibacter sp.]